jgi:hypothetical protein
MEVAVGNVVALTQMAADDEDPVGTSREGAEYMGQVESARAHGADKPYIGGILQSGNSSQVSSPVASPMADKTYYFRFKFTCTHFFSPPDLFLSHCLIDG